MLLGRNRLLTHCLATPCVPVCRGDVYGSLPFHDICHIYLGPEHSAGTGQPSYCTLPMFHPPKNPGDAVNGLGYISNDGHLFECNNPIVMQQAFHV